MRLVEMGSLWGRMGVIIVDRLYDVGCMESVCGPYGFIEGVIYMRFEKCMVCVASHIVNEACTKSVQKSNPRKKHYYIDSLKRGGGATLHESIKDRTTNTARIFSLF